MNIVLANIVTAFQPVTVGTKVLGSEPFYEVLKKAIHEFDFEAQPVRGQGFISLPQEAHALVSAGVGPRINNASAYHAREYRGKVQLFLKRQYAGKIDGVATIVYMRDAYLADPDVVKDEAESYRIRESAATHILVAVLAFAGPKAPLSPQAFLHNLAGGNNEALKWSADEIRALAEQVIKYDNAWCVVAD